MILWIIPTYNNDKTLEGVISDVLKLTKEIIVVNDGSTDNTAMILQKFDSLKVISYSKNKGKGVAMQKGFELAIAEGFNYAITIDSDGQHFASDIGNFVRKAEEEPDALIVGARNLVRENVSQGSSFANRFSNFWYRLLTGIDLPDTQTGFRLYPLDLIKEMRFYTHKYEFELEILVRAAWKGIKVISLPIQVFYPSKTERVSHFRPYRDFARISIVNTVFVLIALFYIKPFVFLKYLRKKNVRDFINKQILLTNDSNTNIAWAITLGIFMGIFPIWGFQFLTAIALAHLFRLNKFIVIVAANISIPPMIPVILYLSYLAGGIVLRSGANLRFSTDLTLKSFENNLLQYLVGSVVFALIMAFFSGMVAFIILSFLRKNRVPSK